MVAKSTRGKRVGRHSGIYLVMLSGTGIRDRDCKSRNCDLAGLVVLTFTLWNEG